MNQIKRFMDQNLSSLRSIEQRAFIQCLRIIENKEKR